LVLLGQRPEHGEHGRVLARLSHQPVQPDVLVVEGRLFPILSLVGRVEDVARFPAQFEIFHGRQNTAVVAHVEEVQVSERLLPGEAGIVTDVHSIVTLQTDFFTIPSLFTAGSHQKQGTAPNIKSVRYRKLLNFDFEHALTYYLATSQVKYCANR
jgi:hypothetical protein